MAKRPRKIIHLREAALSEQKQLPVRLAVILGLGWLPFMALLLIEGATTGTWNPILHRYETYVRWLISVPLLLIGEGVFSRSIRNAVSYLTVSGIADADDKSQAFPPAKSGIQADFGRILSRSESPPAELAVLVIAALLGVPKVLESVSPAEAWYEGVAMTFFRFLLFKGFWKWLLWSWFTWRLSRRTSLRLQCAHPDQMGGLSPVIEASKAKTLFFVAVAATVSASIASLLQLQPGRSVVQYATLIIGTLVLSILIVWLPPLLFSPRLARLKRETRRAYNLLGRRVVYDFEQSYLDRTYEGEINTSSLADFGAVYGQINRTRAMPVDLRTLVQYALAVSIPFAPLFMMEFGVAEFLRKILSILV